MPPFTPVNVAKLAHSLPVLSKASDWIVKSVSDPERTTSVTVDNFAAFESFIVVSSVKLILVVAMVSIPAVLPTTVWFVKYYQLHLNHLLTHSL